MQIHSKMSPASKSKSKDHKAGKESQKAPVKVPGGSNACTVASGSAYDPLLGRFHTLDAVSSRFGNMDNTDDHPGNLIANKAECDSVSNNDSWSGDSDDHREKAPSPAIRQQTIPGGDNDKGEKVRLRNERKHKRQKEKRAQELHEKCTGYLMSRKLEVLAQQLVAMGISSERATMALILNEGKVEESVTWLFEGHDGADKFSEQNLENGSNLKIDISEELTQIADLEARYNCSKQEVEKAIVACEGVLDKAAEALRARKQDLPFASEESGEFPNVNHVAANQNMARPPLQSSNSSTSIQQKRDEKEYSLTKEAVPFGLPSDSGSQHAQPMRKFQTKLEWTRPQQMTLAEKRWLGGETNPPVSYPPNSPLQVSPLPAKINAHHVAVGSEPKTHWSDSVREPVIMMQRPKPISSEHVPTTSISLSAPGAGVVASRRSSINGVAVMKPNVQLPHFPNTNVLSPNDPSSNNIYQKNDHPRHQHFTGTNTQNGPWSRIGSSPTLAAASPLGLFSGFGSSGSSGASSHVDWKDGNLTRHLDYTNIDWSLDLGLSSPSRFLLGAVPPGMKTQMYESYASGEDSRPALGFVPSSMNACSHESDVHREGSRWGLGLTPSRINTQTYESDVFEGVSRPAVGMTHRMNTHMYEPDALREGLRPAMGRAPSWMNTQSFEADVLRDGSRPVMGLRPSGMNSPMFESDVHRESSRSVLGLSHSGLNPHMFRSESLEGSRPVTGFQGGSAHGRAAATL